MTYNIDYSDPSKASISIDDNTTDTSTSLELLGQNYANGYGEIVATNFLHLLENFSSPTVPENPTIGQLWFDSKENVLKIYTTKSQWKSLGNSKVSDSGPITTGDENNGDILVDDVERKVYVYMDGWVLIFEESDTRTFASPKTRLDRAGFIHTTYEITVNGKTVIVLSSDDESWIPLDSGNTPELLSDNSLMINSFPSIEPGLNIYNRNPAQVTITDADPTLTPSQISNCVNPEEESFAYGTYEPLSTLVYNDGTSLAGIGKVISITDGDTTAQFIFDLYLDNLSRNPDKSGFEYWYGIYIAIGETATESAFLNSDNFAREVASGLGTWKTYCEARVTECVDPAVESFTYGAFQPLSTIVYGDGSALEGVGEVISVTSGNTIAQNISDWYTIDLKRNADKDGFEYWYSVYLVIGETAAKAEFLNSDSFALEVASGYGTWRTYCEYRSSNLTLEDSPYLTTGDYRIGDIWVNSETKEVWVYNVSAWVKISNTTTNTRVVARKRSDNLGLTHQTLETIVNGKIIFIDSSDEIPYTLNLAELDENGGPLVNTFSEPIYLGRNGIPVPETPTSATQPISYVPSGAIQAFAMQAVPEGWLECNGNAISRTQYARLFGLIGTTYGTGDGSTTFNLPDLRGEFIRGWDNGRGVDSGRTFGTTQTGQLESHTHGTSRVQVDDADGGVDHWVMTETGEPSTVGTFATDSQGGSETRPRNIALMYCIKS